MSGSVRTIKPRDAQTGDIIQRMQRGRSGGMVPHPLVPSEEIVTAGPRRLITKILGGPLRGQRHYRQRDSVALHSSGYRIIRAVRNCPDEGRCHHSCAKDECFRVRACAPLSDYGEDWTEEDKARFGGAPETPSVEDVIVGG